MKNESELRRWVKKELGIEAVFWVENKGGGTFGMPDCLVPVPTGREVVRGQLEAISKLVVMELKVGDLRQRTLSPSGWEGFYWEIYLRPSQWGVGRRMAKQGVEMWVLVGSTFDEGVGIVKFSDIERVARDSRYVKMEPVLGGEMLMKILLKWVGPNG